MDIVVQIVMRPDEEWVCIPQGSNTVVLNRANIYQLTAAPDFMSCVLRQVEASSHAGVLGDDESLSLSGDEEGV